jgi:hypothetical protein
MHQELITLYCVLYDPYYCRCDPERIWGLIRDCGGAAEYAAVGRVNFFVPSELISIVLLMDGGLRVNWKKSYI